VDFVKAYTAVPRAAYSGMAKEAQKGETPRPMLTSSACNPVPPSDVKESAHL